MSHLQFEASWIFIKCKFRFAKIEQVIEGNLTFKNTYLVFRFSINTLVVTLKRKCWNLLIKMHFRLELKYILSDITSFNVRNIKLSCGTFGVVVTTDARGPGLNPFITNFYRTLQRPAKDSNKGKETGKDTF